MVGARMAVSVGHDHKSCKAVEPIEMPGRELAGRKEPCIRWGPGYLHGRGQF